MKKTKLTLLTVGVLINLLFVTLPNFSRGQGCPVSPMVPEFPEYFSMDVTNTGNDVFQDMHVAVCDGTIPGLWWDCPSCGTTGTIAFHSPTTFDPDVVVLIDNLGFFHAVVVYYDLTGPGTSYGYYWDDYIYSAGTFNWLSTNLLETTPYAGAINIDKTYIILTQFFGIIWADVYGKMYVQEGICGAGPVVLVGTPYLIHSLGEHDPDISMWTNGPNPSMYYTYVDAGGIVKVDKAFWTAPVPTAVNIKSTLNIGSHPRIASPPSSGGMDDAVAVYEYSNVLGNHIYGFEYNGPTSYDYTASCNLYQNKRCFGPAITYSNDGQDVTVAWTMDYSNTNTGPDNIEPIALHCDALGNIILINNYLKVPILYSPYGPDQDYQGIISLCGRDYMGVNPTPIYYDWFWVNNDLNNPVNWMKGKSVNYNFNNLRIDNNGENSEFVSGIYPNPNNGNFTIKLNIEKGEMITISIYNILGQKIFSYDDISISDKFTKEISIANYDAGIYFVRESGTSTNNNWKLVITK